MSAYDDDAERYYGELCDLCGEVFADCSCSAEDLADPDICTDCDGRGKTIEGRCCPMCDGTGRDSW